MDLTNINKTTTIITPDTETESPPPQTHPTTKSFSFTNGSFYHLHLHHSHHPPPLQMVVSYKECLKNHAASIGGHALDGCGEFMPSPTATSTDPTSLKCAACGCHRNFHRRDSYDPNSSPPSLALPPPSAPPSSAAAALNPISPSPSTDPSSAHSPDANSPQRPAVTSPAPCSYYSSAPHMLLALSSGYAAAARDHYPHHHASFHQVATKRESHPSAKKRSRTKFSREQKDKMQAFAEKLGWRMNKAEERLTEEFCRQVGVSRRVFKVWMHNNKQALGKKLGLDNINAAHMVNSKNDGVNGYTINGDNNNQNEAGSVHPVTVSPKSED